jgi:hypothetical protein
MVRGTNASEVLGGVGLATPQPPSFAPGGLVLLLWEEILFGPIRPLTLGLIIFILDIDDAYSHH